MTTFSMFLDGYTIAQPFSGYDVEIKRPDGRRAHLRPTYTTDDYAYCHEATMARAMRYVALCEARRAREVLPTPNMIEAGARAFRQCDLRVDDATSVALTIFEEMWRSRLARSS